MRSNITESWITLRLNSSVALSSQPPIPNVPDHRDRPPRCETGRSDAMSSESALARGGERLGTIRRWCSDLGPRADTEPPGRRWHAHHLLECAAERGFRLVA